MLYTPAASESHMISDTSTHSALEGWRGRCECDGVGDMADVMSDNELCSNI